MKRLSAALGLCTLLAGLFLWGMFGAVTPALFIGFCGWTPATIFLGYTLARSGIRLSFDQTAAPPARPAAPAGRSPRRLQQQEKPF
jgi:hypothetical protein